MQTMQTEVYFDAGGDVRTCDEPRKGRGSRRLPVLGRRGPQYVQARFAKRLVSSPLGLLSLR